MATVTESKGTLWGIFRYRDLRLLLIGLAVSKAGDWLYVVGLQVYVFQQTHSPAWVAAATIIRLLPTGFLAPIGGSIADRYERRLVMISSDLARCLLMLLLALVAWRGGSPALALALAFAASTAGSPYLPAAGATTPALVPESELAAANSALSVIDHVGIFVGPALGALLLLAGPPATAFAINGVTFLASALAVLLMRTRSRPSEAAAVRLASHLWEGLRAILASPGAIAICGFLSVTSLLYGMETVQLVVLSDHQLGAGAAGYGYLLAGLGVGGAAAGLVAGYLAGLPRPGLLLTSAVVVMGLSISALAYVHGVGAAFPLLAVQGVANIVTDVTAFTLLQRALPEDLLARVFGFVRLAIIASTLLGALVAPPLLQAVGLDSSLVIPGLVAGALALAAVPLTRRLTLEAMRTFEASRARYQELSRLSILQGVPRPVLELLARGGEEVDAPASSVILRQGDAADALYVLEAGAVDVETGRGGSHRHLARLEAGDYFGEIGILQGVPRTATVVAATPVRLYRIAAEDFLAAVSAAPALSGALADGMAARLARGGSLRRSRRRPLLAGEVGGTA